MNGGLGNLGVSLCQLVLPLIFTIGGNSDAAIGGLRRHRSHSVSVLEPTFTTNQHHIISDRVVIAMVGLPARSSGLKPGTM